MSLFSPQIFRKTIRRFGILLAGLSILCSSLPVQAGIKEDNIAANQAVPVESNQVAGWPQGPVVSAHSAILIEANTGTVLYAKNIHTQEYPASTTKILTSLIAFESCSLDEMVTFSHDAIYDVPYDSNHIALDVGEALTMEDCLKAILIRSANEVSFGVAEHISGGHWKDFGPIMNERAKELGCLNSNFINPNGLPDENHYTTAYDLAMIGRAFFSNEILCNMTTTRVLKLEPTQTQPDTILEANQMSLLPGKEYAYEYLVGCKTGYTNAARSSLVSCAEKDGLKLICVVLRDEAPYQYEDTIALFEYGFSNFQKLNIAEHDTKHSMNSDGLFYSGNDVLGNSQPILSLNTSDYVVVPASADFADIDSTISYETESDTQAAIVTYTYQDVVVGTASIDFTGSLENSYEFDTSAPGDGLTGENTDDGGNSGSADADKTGNHNPENESSDADNTSSSDGHTPSLLARIGRIILTIVLTVIGLAALAVLIIFIRNYIIIQKRRRRRKRRHGTRISANDPYRMINSSSRKRTGKDVRRRQQNNDKRDGWR